MCTLRLCKNSFHVKIFRELLATCKRDTISPFVHVSLTFLAVLNFRDERISHIAKTKWDATVIAQITLRQHSKRLRKLLLRHDSIHNIRVWTWLLLAGELMTLFFQELVLISDYVPGVSKFLVVPPFSLHWISHLLLKENCGVHVGSATAGVLRNIAFTWGVAANCAVGAGILLLCEHRNFESWFVCLGTVRLVALLLFVFIIFIEALRINC